MKREIMNRRDRYVKYYDLGHGQRQAVLYPKAVHYRKQDEWKDIDNRLVMGERSGKAVWRNQDNPMKAEFAYNAQDKRLARIEYEGHVVEWGFAAPGINKIGAGHIRREESRKDEAGALPANMVSCIEYDEVLPGIGVRYMLNGMACKEEIIVANKEALANTAIELNSNGLTFRAAEDNGLEAHKDGTPVFRFAPPVVSDSGELKDIPIGFKLTEANQGVRMEYLHSPKRKSAPSWTRW